MTTIMWFRNDLRTQDLPALAAAMEQADYVVPVFIFDRQILSGKNCSSNRNRFLIESLVDLRKQLIVLGSNLVIREGNPDEVLAKLAEDTKANSLHYTVDYSPYAIQRDKAVTNRLEEQGVHVTAFPGNLAVNSLQNLRTKNGKVFRVFTPFWKQWLSEKRREIVSVSRACPLPLNTTVGNILRIEDVANDSNLSPDALHGGESNALKRLDDFIANDLQMYIGAQNDLSVDRTSKLSPYLHFGCISIRQIEEALPPTDASTVFHRQLAWRDFYQYILFHFPDNLTKEFQPRYRLLEWPGTQGQFVAWQNGLTGYPIVDAAMRQLKQEGWMHNRARLIVGSFLTKHLGIDWRKGQAHFMQWLCDGDHASNNGNWQWISSVGVDPAPMFRRLYNPSSQTRTYDPEGVYIKKYVPELYDVPIKHLAEPWSMSIAQQQAAGCIIGVDYPEPIVDHRSARQAALERYRATKEI